jgi:hypothetical protein
MRSTCATEDDLSRLHPIESFSLIPAGLACSLLIALAPAAPAGEGRSGPVESSTEFSQVDRALDDIEAAIQNAYFQTALGIADTTRGWFDELPAGGPLAGRRARLELLAATAEVALGRNQQALESMRRALVADSSLTLDPDLTPPKLYALLGEARAGAVPASLP